MIARNIQFIGLFLAAFVAWMLSGSPIPMAFSLLFPLVAFVARFLRRPDSEGVILGILFSFLGLLALLAEIHLFRTGLAFAFRADLPFSFHLGMALLWVSTSFVILFPKSDDCLHPDSIQIPALAGFLLVFASSIVTEFYDYEEWQVLPLAALPLAWFAVQLLLNEKGFIVRLASTGGLCLALTGLAIGVDRSLFRIQDAIYNPDSQLSESGDLRRPPPVGLDGNAELGARRLPRETNLQFDGQVRVVLQTESPTLFQTWRSHPIYLRASTVSLFESDELIAPIRSGRWIYDADDEIEDLSITFSRDDSAPVASYSVFTRKAAANAIPLLPSSSTLSVSAVYEYADDWYQLTPPEEASGVRYEAFSQIPRTKLDSFSSKEYVRSDAPVLYLNLPPSPLAGRIRTLSESLSSRDLMKAIRDYLENETSYSVQYETPPEETPVGNLLFGNKEGHCEIYAAAAVLLLRASGIPSRIAYGYAGGMMDRERKMIAFRDQDSHAWAEVLTPDNEWVIYDVTPRVSSAPPRTPSLTSLSEFSTDGYFNLSEGAGSPDGRRRPYRDRLSDLIVLFSDHFLEISLLAFLFASGIMVWHRKRDRGASTTPLSKRPEQGSPQLNELLHLLEKCGAELGMLKTPGMTWKEWLQLETGSPECFSEAVDYYYETRYVGMTSSIETERRIRKSLSEWREKRVGN